jgi:hypothetical protein
MFWPRAFFGDPRGRLPEHEDRFILRGVSSAARTLIVVHCYKETIPWSGLFLPVRRTGKEVRFHEEGI